MRQNYQGNKRRKEEQRKKKQEEKRNRRLQRKEQSALPAQKISGTPFEAVPQDPSSSI